MKGRHSVAAIVATIVLAASSMMAGGALAGGGDGPSTSEPIASFRIIHDPSGDEYTYCEGADGTYLEERGRSEGPITSTDDRLTGRLIIVHYAFLNQSTLTGWVTADTEIRDEVTDAVKFTGKIYAVIKGLPSRGVMVGETADGDTVVMSATTYHDPERTKPHAVTGTIGAPSTVTDLAVISPPGCPPA